MDDYDGQASAVWLDAKDGQDLYQRVKALPGFGEQKARIFVGLLGKQLGVRPPGWEAAAGKFGQPGTFMSVADIVDPDIARARARLQAAAQGRAKASQRIPDVDAVQVTECG